MIDRRARDPIAGMPPVLGTLVLLALLTPLRAATPSPTCDRYAVNGLTPGMAESIVRRKMGGDGVSHIIRNQNNEEASGVDYPGPPTDVYVQYDRRIDKGRARTVLVRASMPFSAGAAQSLVNRFGPPQAGADSLASGLNDGAAIWVDQTCGLVLTAYRPSANWWTGAGGALLQLETLEQARESGSPAAVGLQAILNGKPAPAAAPAVVVTKPPEDAPKPEVVVVPMDAPAPADGETQTAEAAPEAPPTAPPVEVEVAAAAPAPQPSPAPEPPPSPEPETQAQQAQNAPPTEPPAATPPEPAPAQNPVDARDTQRAAEVVPPPLSRQTPNTTGETKPEPATQRAAEVVPPPLSKQTPGTSGETKKPATISSWRSERPPAAAPATAQAAPPSQSISNWRSPARSATAVPEPAPVPVPPPAGANTTPQAIKTTPPVYPATAKWLGMKGHVKLEVVVLADGTVGSRPRVLSATPAGRGFEESAIAAVRAWRFHPATRDGVAVESKTTIDVAFE